LLDGANLNFIGYAENHLLNQSVKGFNKSEKAESIIKQNIIWQYFKL
jgi:hypothetical protein